MFPQQPEAGGMYSQVSTAIRIREDLIAKGVNRNIHAAIRESRARSERIGLDTAIDAMPAEDEEVYRGYLAEHRSFLDTVRLILENLGNHMELTHSMIQLINPQGMIVKADGDPGMIRKGEKMNNVPGSICSEEAIGTNGAGLALKLKKPAMIIGSEHYLDIFQDWTCLAYPIMNNGSKQVVGVLNMTCPQEIFSPHSLGLIQYGVFSIENLIHHQNMQGDYLLLEAFTQELHASRYMMVINKYGELVHSTENFAALLGMANASKEMISAHLRSSEHFKYLISPHDGEFEFQFKCNDDKEVRFVGKPIWRDHQFLGWLIKAFPVPQYNYKAVAKSQLTFERLVGNSLPFKMAVNQSKQAAASQATLLLTGATGTGKELFAQSVHNESSRKTGPFVSLNCGAIPKELIASELFGYEEGAFSGAKRGGAKGKFEAAQKGTLFLDEIGELPPEQQVYLLRVLQERTVTRLGGNKEIAVDVRLIAATNTSLKQKVEQNSFRADLYFRLNVISLHLPSLKERGREDIILLCKHFLNKYNQHENKNISLSDEVMEALTIYDWPGNIRELENVMYRLVVLSAGTDAVIGTLPDEFLNS